MVGLARYFALQAPALHRSGSGYRFHCVGSRDSGPRQRRNGAADCSLPDRGGTGLLLFAVEPGCSTECIRTWVFFCCASGRGLALLLSAAESGDAGSVGGATKGYGYRLRNYVLNRASAFVSRGLRAGGFGCADALLSIN